MKKNIAKIFYFLLAFSIILNIYFIYILSTPINKTSYDVDSLYKIFNEIVDEEFYSAKFNGEYLELKDKDYNVIKKYHYPEIEKTKEIKTIRKEIRGNATYVFFIYYSAIDDESGVFRCTENNIDMSGMNEIHKLGAGFYYYDTMASMY